MKHKKSRRKTRADRQKESTTISEKRNKGRNEIEDGREAEKRGNEVEDGRKGKKERESVVMRRKKTCLEPSRALLIHLGARRHAVDGHEEQLARTHHGENAINVFEDALDHFVLVGRVVLRVGK